MGNGRIITQGGGLNRRNVSVRRPLGVENKWEDQNFKRRRFSDTQPFAPSSVRTKYIQPAGCKSPSMTVSETPRRTIGPVLPPDDSAYNGMFPSGAVLSAVTVTFCPSLNMGSREGATGAADPAAV